MNKQLKKAFALQNSGQLSAAKEYYLTILQDLSPQEQAIAEQQLGNLYYMAEDYAQAITHYQLALTDSTDSKWRYNALYNLATCLLRLDQFGEAEFYYRWARTLQPDDPDLLYNLGVIAQQKNQLIAAKEFFSNVLQKTPDHFAALTNLAALALRENQRPQALIYYQKLQQLQPKNKMVGYLIAAITGQQIYAQPPPEYIEQLFDHYAGHFEQHLQQDLHYTLPELLHTLLMEHLGKPAANLFIVELGCGSGLCGMILRPYARELHGIDLSSRMLQQARQKKCYDQLLQADFLQALNNYQAVDLLVAADAMVYCGDLVPLFQLAYNALKAGGFWFFNTETTTAENYELTTSGRYAHNPQTIENLARQAGFSILQHATGIPRTQNDLPVKCDLWLLHKIPSAR